MPRKKRLNSLKRKRRVDTFDYKDATKSLKKFGFKIPKQKKKLKAFYRTKAAYIKYITEDRTVSPIIGTVKRKKGAKGKIKSAKVSRLKYRFKFQKLSKKKLAVAKKSGVFSSNQFSPTGVFVERSIGIKAKDFKISFKDNGEVSITSDCRHDEIVPINPTLLAVDPEKAVTDAIENRKCRDSRGKLRKPKTFSLMVNGYRAQTTSSLSLKSFLYYMTNNLLKRWTDQNGDDAEEEFADVFHVRIIY